jgi:ferric-dicitrate binding protein FerR (iron transport regulator)
VLTAAASAVRLRGEMQRKALSEAAEQMRPLTHQGEDLMQQMIEIFTSAGQEGPPPSNTGVRMS